MWQDTPLQNLEVQAGMTQAWLCPYYMAQLFLHIFQEACQPVPNLLLWFRVHWQAQTIVANTLRGVKFVTGDVQKEMQRPQKNSQRPASGV